MKEYEFVAQVRAGERFFGVGRPYDVGRNRGCYPVFYDFSLPTGPMYNPEAFRRQFKRRFGFDFPEELARLLHR